MTWQADLSSFFSGTKWDLLRVLEENLIHQSPGKHRDTLQPNLVSCLFSLPTFQGLRSLLPTQVARRFWKRKDPHPLGRNSRRRFNEKKTRRCLHRGGKLQRPYGPCNHVKSNFVGTLQRPLCQHDLLVSQSRSRKRDWRQRGH